MPSFNGNTQGTLTALLSCFGLMADIYDVGIVNLVRPVLEEQFGTMTPSQDALLTGSTLGGAIVGQLAFGASADYIGRKCLFVSTAALVGFASLGSACASGIQPLGLSIYAVLAVWRFLMGLGIGGEYPLAAASTVENNDPSSSARSLAIAFSGMALGHLLAPGVVMLLAGPMAVSHARLWRYAFGFGAVLALVVAVLRFYVLRETRAWLQASGATAADSRVVAAATAPQTQRWKEKLAALSAMKWSMAATAGVWLIYDVVPYGTGLYSTKIFPAEPGLNSAYVVLYITLITLPGYAGAVLLASRVRMKHLQLYGLFGMTVCFSLLALLHNKANRGGLGYLSIFAFQRCIDAMGPGVATFTIPAQIFPTRIRATAHGISAAAGKLGAVIGTVIFPNLQAAAGLQAVMAFMALISALTAFWTQLATPLYDVSVLEEIAALDTSMGVVQQATMAESLLFAASSSKAEGSSLRREPKAKGGTDYGGTSS